MKRTLRTMALTGTMAIAVLLSGGLAQAAEKTDAVKSKSSFAQESVSVSVADPVQFDGNQDSYVLPIKPNLTRRLRYDRGRMVPPYSDDRADCDDLTMVSALARALGLVDFGQVCTP